MSSIANPRRLPNKPILVAWIALAAIALATIAISVAASKPWDAPDFATGFVVGILVWSVSPHAGLALTLLLFRRFEKLAVAAAIVAVLIALAGLGLVCDVLFIHLDPQSGIALLFIPFYEWLATGVLAFLGGISLAVSVVRMKRGQS